MIQSRLLHLTISVVMVAWPVLLPAQQAGTLRFPPQHSSIEHYSVSIRDTSIQLHNTLVVRESEVVRADSVRTLKRELDYLIDYSRGIISFLPGRLAVAPGDTSRHTVTITYNCLPITLKKEYSLREVFVLRD